MDNILFNRPDVQLDQALYVFISYARSQEALAAQIETYLKAAGVRVFRDTSDIRTGANWDMAIETALHECNRMVLLLSPDSMPYRKEVHREWFYFDQERKPLYPLYVAKCSLHSRLYAYNYIDVTTLGLAKALAVLCQELQVDFQAPAGEADRIIVVDTAEAQPLPDLLADLLDAIKNPRGSIALTKAQIKQLVEEYKPHNLTQYRLTRIAEWSQPRYQLDNRFVSLTLLIDQGEDAQGARWAASETRRFNDLREVLADHPDDPVLVLLGAPGSGKSTLLRRFQLDQAMDCLRSEAQTKEILTFFVPLNAYRADAGSPRKWLEAEWTRRYPDLSSLASLLDQGRLILLLDALNEMPHKDTADYHERVGQWRDFIQEIVPHGNRAIFSCRTLDYSAYLSSPELRVPQMVVQAMSDEQIQVFLSSYLPAQATMAWAELAHSPQLDMFRTPYFLKLLCEQIEVSNKVPQGRAALFTGFVRQVLHREIENRHALFMPDSLLTDKDHTKLTLHQWRSPYDLPERGILIPKICQLAYTMQEKGLDTEGAQVRIDYDAACDALHSGRDEDILKAGVSLNVLDEDISQSTILFFHQLLQEFFAARQLARHPRPELVQVEWQVGKVTEALEDTIAKLADSDPLPLLPQTGWEETTLLAAVMATDPEAFIRKLMEVNLPLAARATASPEIKVTAALKHDIQTALIARTQDMTADLRARMAAGLALGEVGDPRFERRTGPFGDYLLPPLVTIPAGDYPIGRDDSGYTDEQPRHVVTLDTFQMGIFPVTNAEYALFMAAGGYEDDQWWDTGAAKAWRRGEGSNEGGKWQWRENRRALQSLPIEHINALVQQNRITSKQAEDWITIRNWTDERFEGQLDEWYPSGKIYRGPEYWEDATLNNRSQPVVGITWYEARAYCAWLSAQTGQAYRLPTEVEVEAAAAGRSGRQYTYGPSFEVARSNTFESHIRRTTPIGIFNNATPEGAFDVTGNAYTWTSSAYQPYPYSATDGREDEHSTDVRRVVRGGSWVGNQDAARAANRDYGSPDSRSDCVGFRGVCGRPPS